MNRDEALTECAISVKPELWGYNRQMDYREHSFGWNEYMQRRTELINEPDDADAPEWARWKAQDADGDWFWFKIKPGCGSDQWGFDCGFENNLFANDGECPAGHNWRTMLREVKRDMSKNEPQYDPRDVAFKRQLNPATSSLTDSQASESALETGMCSDGVTCHHPEANYCDECPNAPHAQDARRLDEQLGADVKAASKHYRHSYKGVKLDPYRIADVYEMHGGPREQILKKVLRFTDKGHAEQQVINEIRSALDRWQEMLDEDAAN